MIYTIYVRLLDEGIDVWRPVQAEEGLASDTYHILHSPHNFIPNNEKWEYEPGTLVKVQEKDSNGQKILVACSYAR